LSFSAYPCGMARRGTGPSPLLIAAAVCIAAAVASLALPSGPTYDSYSWLIWGRDLAHLTLSTSGTGTSWKPLPAIVDALLTPLGRGVPDAWLVIARAGALFAVAMAFRLAWRLSPGGGRLVGGLVAAASVALTQKWLASTGVGDAEGLMTALALLAVDRHLDGHVRQAFWLLVTAALIRIEMLPFVTAYGAWLVWTKRARWSVPAGVLLVPLLWFGADWLGSGRLGTAAGVARHRKPGSPGASAHPALAVLQEAYSMLPWTAWVAIVFALAFALVARRARTSRVVFVLAGWAAAWTAIVALMAEHGYAGLQRFVFMAAALESVVAGIGAGLLVEWVRRRAPRLAPATLAGVAACCAFAVGAVPNARLVPGELAGIDHVADMDAGLSQAVKAAGGASIVLRCGAPVTPWYAVTTLEWDLHVQPGGVQDRLRRGRRVVVQPADGGWQVRAADCPSDQ
jgi:hypothetical protein